MPEKMFSSSLFQSKPKPKLNYSLIALDIDGTLLNEHKEITRANQEALRTFQVAGGKVVLISGRLPRSILWHTQLLDLNTPFAALNGALIGNGEQIVSGVAFHRDVVLNFIAYCQRHGLYCHIYSVEGMIFDTPACWNEHWPEQNLARLEGQQPPAEWVQRVREYCPALRVDDLAGWVKTTREPIYKMAVLSESSLEETARDLGQISGLSVTSSDPRNLEICPTNVSKGAALRQIANSLAIRPEQIMAIGDNYNDLSLFQVAGLSVAMGNAPEAVQQQAQVVTRSNCESGVAWAVHRWALRGGL
ncbi:HAD family phosphatase [Desulfosporosinus fructosivorans]|uniref:HAD family phosphatase n=1 Tax=Desulfosporosinus fructosivorans TaxID=2018669 RepID=A0A4Z0RCD3_9FIRM|nr:Cof-type HAD-IIB family hydrolase [Desulfosporosinus fructosivorans]TGE39633.1 HAD family phosphatase [Desulfosporosinus fructosivorans]